MFFFMAFIVRFEESRRKDIKLLIEKPAIHGMKFKFMHNQNIFKLMLLFYFCNVIMFVNVIMLEGCL